jgi:uncharacterized protein (TIGR02118 family)
VIKLTCLLKRKPGLSRDEFETYWRDVHGPLVKSTRSGSHVLRYEQHPATQSDGWDGVTEQWFESVEDFYASLAEDDYKLIDEDTRKFLDVSALEFLLTDEPRVVME